jgi:hypothetical protein
MLASEIANVDFFEEEADEIYQIPENWDERGHLRSSKNEKLDRWVRYAIYISQERFDANPIHRKFIHPENRRKYVFINDFWFRAIIQDEVQPEVIYMFVDEYADIPKNDRYVVNGASYALRYEGDQVHPVRIILK